MLKRLRKRGFTLIELMIVVAIIGILAAIAIPNFIRFQARSKQGEAKANLKSLFTAQRSYYQEKDKYVEDIHTIGFSPERGNRYYYVAGTGSTEDRKVAPATVTATDSAISVDVFKYTTATDKPTSANAGAPTWKPAAGGATPAAAPLGGVAGACPVCEFSGFAYGNIDNETTGIDAWYVGSIDSTNVPYKGSQENVPAGQPQNSYNDVTLDI